MKKFALSLAVIIWIAATVFFARNFYMGVKKIDSPEQKTSAVEVQDNIAPLQKDDDNPFGASMSRSEFRKEYERRRKSCRQGFEEKKAAFYNSYDEKSHHEEFMRRKNNF